MNKIIPGVAADNKEGREREVPSSHGSDTSGSAMDFSFSEVVSVLALALVSLAVGRERAGVVLVGRDDTVSFLAIVVVVVFAFFAGRVERAGFAARRLAIAGAVVVVVVVLAVEDEAAAAALRRVVAPPLRLRVDMPMASCWW